MKVLLIKYGTTNATVVVIVIETKFISVTADDHGKQLIIINE